jgi:hypothetical protein
MGNMKCEFKIADGNPKGRDLDVKQEDNIKMDIH